MQILTGDCREVLRTLADNSVDAVVCDPPYELGFMSSKWDGTGIAYEIPMWQEVLRVLKPGGHLLAFGGTRTYHRMACAVEDAGFEIRDCLQWIFGTGFPKSLYISKAIDAAAGAARERQEERQYAGGHVQRSEAPRFNGNAYSGGGVYQEPPVRYETAPATDAAKQWEGWGTALKPAYEPIILARKKLAGTVAANVLKHGTGGLNINGCRIEGAPEATRFDPAKHLHKGWRMAATGAETAENAKQMNGRWPANILLNHTEACVLVGSRRVKANGHHPKARGVGGLSTAGHSGQSDLVEAYAAGELVEQWDCAQDCPVRMLDAQSAARGIHGAGHARDGSSAVVARSYDASAYELGPHRKMHRLGDVGGASRFFYCAKASRSERDAGCESLAPKTAGEVTGGRQEGSDGLNSPRAGAGRTSTEIPFNKISAPSASWVFEVLCQQLPADTAQLLARGTAGSTIQCSDGSVWSTCSCGSPSTDLSHPAMKSTIAIAINSTIDRTTWKPPRRPHTNGCIAAACGVTARGGSPADYAGSSNPSTPSTGTSAIGDTPSTGDAAPATSIESWLTSEPVGGGHRVGVRNSHPT